MNLKDPGTNPAPRNLQSTWDSHLQPLHWCLHLQGLGCNDVLHSDSRPTVTIAERDGPRVSSPNHRQSPEDGGDWQNIHNLLPRKGLVDQFGAALVDP